MSRFDKRLNIIFKRTVLGRPILFYIHLPGQFKHIETDVMLVPAAGNRTNLRNSYDVTHHLAGCSAAMDWGFDDCVYAAAAAGMCAELGCTNPYRPTFGICGDCPLDNFTKKWVEDLDVKRSTLAVITIHSFHHPIYSPTKKNCQAW